MRPDHQRRLRPFPKTDRWAARSVDDTAEEHLVQRHVHMGRLRGRWNQIPVQVCQVVVGHRSASIPDARGSTNFVDALPRQPVHVDRVVVLPSAAADLHRPKGGIGRARRRRFCRRPAGERRHPLSGRLGCRSVWHATGDGGLDGGLCAAVSRLPDTTPHRRLHRLAFPPWRRGRRILACRQRIDCGDHASEPARSSVRHHAVHEHGRHAVGTGGRPSRQRSRPWRWRCCRTFASRRRPRRLRVR